MKTSSRRLSSSSSEDVFIKTKIFALHKHLQNKSSRRLDQYQYIRLGHTSSRRFQFFFTTSCKNVFKTSSRYLQDVLQRCPQNVFKTYHQVKLFLLTRFQDVFETYSKCFWDVLQRPSSTERFAKVTLLRNLWSVHKICKSNKSFSSYSLSLCYIFYNLFEHLQWSFFAKILKLFLSC